MFIIALNYYDNLKKETFNKTSNRTNKHFSDPREAPV